MRNNKIMILAMVLMFCFVTSGCSKIDELKVKAGLKNNDFEYIKQGKIETIVIQNTRDQGFRFTVTDKNVINEIYDVLSKAKVSSKKSSLEPDYTFEMKESNNKIHKFSYITGLDKKDAGNFYSDNKTYIVSKRIDSDIINTYWNIRKPKNFKEVYYKSIIGVLDQYLKDSNKNKSIGVNLKSDVDCAKFILSTDLQDFNSNLSSKFKTVKVADKDKDNYDIWLTIKTEGYKSTMYKATVTLWDKEAKTEKKYYIDDNYKTGSWDLNITNTKPDKF
ncbi:hypothetical protein HBE96_02630 [Clostridium sp. P21]|uniref:YhfM-like domain-containing protein n=2 Tax=Clostridium muellerianum TaxID=2716538 RepID=A0A7Y0HN47_9CLOT|nr:hypothetical protein [Clostridium muellerianum]